MAIEKRWARIPPILFAVDGTVDGLVTVTSTSRLRVKQEAVLKATGEPALPVEIKRVLSKTQLIVGPRNSKITEVIDVSAYTTAKASTIEVPEQPRPSIPDKEYERASYEEEPVVAKRVYLIDETGEPWDENNPFPVLATVSDNAPQNCFIFRIPYATAGVEQTQVIPNNTKKLYVSIVDLNAKLRVSFTENGTIDGGNYITEYIGNKYEREGLKLVNKTLYYQANKSDVIIEIEAWV